MSIPVLKYTGEQAGRSIVLPDEIFGITPNDHAIYLDVRAIRSNRRQGTHKTKGRSEVRGSRRKIRRQKGTGNARVGDIKSPLFRGGGRIFGPQPRDYGFKLNKKVKSLAQRSALSYKAQSGSIIVLESFSFELPRTKNYHSFLENLSCLGQKTLLILPGVDKNLILSSRNIPCSGIVCSDHINTYDLLDVDKLLFTEEALTLMFGSFNTKINELVYIKETYCY